MQLKNKFLTGAALAGAIALTATVSFAQETKTDTNTDKATKQAREGKRGGKGHFGRGFGKRGMGQMGRMGGFGLRGITLTDAQKEQIRAIREANKPDQALRDELRTIHQSRKSGTDLTAEQKARINVIRDQMRTRQQNVRDQIMNILTAEQKTKLEQRRTQMQQRREQMKQKREEFRKQRELRKKPAADGTKTVI